MGQRSATATAEILTFAIPTPRLFKSDHPRAIDRYIDYFAGAAADGSDERVLDLLEEVSR